MYPLSLHVYLLYDFDSEYIKSCLLSKTTFYAIRLSNGFIFIESTIYFVDFLGVKIYVSSISLSKGSASF